MPEKAGDKSRPPLCQLVWPEPKPIRSHSAPASKWGLCYLKAFLSSLFCGLAVPSRKVKIALLRRYFIIIMLGESPIFITNHYIDIYGS
jgi:hypothetical protein